MKTKELIISKCLVLLLLLFINVQSIDAQNPMKKSKQPEKITGYAPVNGMKLYYEVYGEGEPILLLHGAFMSIDMNWSELIPELSKTRKVIAIEMQGHGRTADIERPISYEGLASDAAGVLQYLKLKNVDVIGYSLGGTVAFQLAIKNPELVNKLVILSSTYKSDGWLPEVKAMFQSFQPDFFDNTPLYAEYKRLAPDAGHWHKFIGKMIESEKKEYSLGDENMKNIKSPTLLIMGDNDGVDLKQTASMYRLLGGGVSGDIAGLPKSQLAIIPGMTHVSLMMSTDKLIPMINTFLNTK
ncbi:alpha/beta fold hydrolase [Flavobacterium sp. '19STA2R22 D10 B1']|uniref:alpha/beta fold hydrolase n=1 Tax=Flavobacterium aerium TaxID=3037261 RepID=UPI00278C38EE|nr:alpha/beta hydrolase [Flavobacterium sp. '19STA2R22 D10 B1']